MPIWRGMSVNAPMSSLMIIWQSEHHAVGVCLLREVLLVDRAMLQLAILPHFLEGERTRHPVTNPKIAIELLRCLWLAVRPREVQ